MPIIKNIDQLAKTQLRRDALLITEAGYESIDIAAIFKAQLQLSGSVLTANISDFIVVLRESKHE